MAAKRPYFPFYVNDFETDPVVEAMTTEQIGAYLLLLCKAWRETPAGSIPKDDATLARWTRLKLKRWDGIKAGVLKAFRTSADGRFIQKRMTEEAAKLADRAAINAENGRLGGLGVSKRTPSERLANGGATDSEFRLSETEAYAGARPESESVCVSESSSPGEGEGCGERATPAPDPAFEAFWQQYPRKTARDAALEAWRSLAPDDELQAAISLAIDRQKHTDQWRRGVIPNPSNWLSDRRWLDDIQSVDAASDRRKVETKQTVAKTTVSEAEITRGRDLLRRSRQRPSPSPIPKESP